MNASLSFKSTAQTSECLIRISYADDGSRDGARLKYVLLKVNTSMLATLFVSEHKSATLDVTHDALDTGIVTLCAQAHRIGHMKWSN